MFNKWQIFHSIWMDKQLESNNKIIIINSINKLFSRIKNLVLFVFYGEGQNIDWTLLEKISNNLCAILIIHQFPVLFNSPLHVSLIEMGTLNKLLWESLYLLIKIEITCIQQNDWIWYPLRINDFFRIFFIWLLPFLSQLDHFK